MSIPCKFQCRSIEPFPSDPERPPAKRVILDHWNPPGRLDIVIDDPETLARLKVGGRYYIDFIVA